MADEPNVGSGSEEAKQVQGEGWLGFEIDQINQKLTIMKHEMKDISDDVDNIEDKVGADHHTIQQIKSDVKEIKSDVSTVMRALAVMNQKLDTIISYTKPPIPRLPVKFKVTVK